MQDNYKENVVNNVNTLIIYMYSNSILYLYFFTVLVLEKTIMCKSPTLNISDQYNGPCPFITD